MGRFYLRNGFQPTYVGIDLTNMTTGVGLFMGTVGSRPGEGEYVSMRLTPEEADKLADELKRVAQFVRDDNAP